jgi:hypothetical protein
MRKHIFLSTLLATSLLSSSVFAQAPVKYSRYLMKAPSIRKFYVGSGLDALIFSTATIHHDANTPGVNGTSPQSINTLGTMRFTGFLNIGVTANFNVSPHFGIYTGLDLKNVGYIEQNNGYTLKRRTYNVGVPLGFKFGNMARNKGYLFLGGGLDAPINYYEKYFHDRTNKTYTLNEWFSDRTPSLMPYVFLGAAFNHGVTAKIQYYPNNFLSENYTDNNGNTPNAGTVVNLILFSIGFNMYWHVEHNHDHSATVSYGNWDDPKNRNN